MAESAESRKALRARGGRRRRRMGDGAGGRGGAVGPKGHGMGARPCLAQGAASARFAAVWKASRLPANAKRRSRRTPCFSPFPPNICATSCSSCRLNLSRRLVLCMKGIERGTGKLVTEVAAEARANWQVRHSFRPFLRAQRRAGTANRGDHRGACRARREAAGDAGQCGLPALRERGHDGRGARRCGQERVCHCLRNRRSVWGLGENARAALLARSFAELCRLGRSLGARDETLTGLSGLGDLVLTATSITSRNYAFGVSLGKGGAVRDLTAPEAPLAEGVATAPALVQRAQLLVDRIADRRNGIGNPVRRAGAERRGAAADGAALQDGVRTMLFVITAIDRENSRDLRMATRPAHFEYVRENRRRQARRAFSGR